MDAAARAGSELRAAQDRRRVEEAGRWEVRANGKAEPLVKESGYRQAGNRRAPFDATKEKFGRLGRMSRAAAFSVFRAAERLRAAGRERARCEAEFDAVIRALENAGFASTRGRFPVSNSLAGRRARLEEFNVVLQVRRRGHLHDSSAG
jgi:hypothetical protein